MEIDTGHTDCVDIIMLAINWANPLGLKPRITSSFFFLLCDSFPSVAYLFFLSLYLSGLLPLFFLLSLLCFSLSPIFIFICFFSYFWLILKMEVGREWGKRRLYTIIYINGLVHFNNNYFIITFCWVVNNILVSILFFGFFFFSSLCEIRECNLNIQWEGK